jgi:hypothetical protein
LAFVSLNGGEIPMLDVINAIAAVVAAAAALFSLYRDRDRK